MALSQERLERLNALYGGTPYSVEVEDTTTATGETAGAVVRIRLPKIDADALVSDADTAK